MKKLFIVSVIALLSQSVFGVDIIVRHNRGIFGYDRVDVTQGANSNDRQLNCTDPGKLKCRWPSNLENSGNYNDILDLVDAKIETERQFTGSFQQNGFYITYEYRLEDDYLLVKIYTETEARENGFIR